MANVPHTPSLMPDWLPAFNKKVTNRIQGLWAPYLPPWIVIEHVGRRSGKRYRTPVMAFKRGDRLYVNLVYGSSAQWVQNVMAAGGAEATRMGKHMTLGHPRIVTRPTADMPLPIGVRLTGGRTGILILEVV